MRPNTATALRQPRARTIAWLCALAVSGCAHTLLASQADIAAYRARCHREEQVLVAQPTPGNLALAAALAVPTDVPAGQAVTWIERAAALAPHRPALVWAQLALCRRYQCEAQGPMQAHLQVLDPDNGFAWLWSLEQAQATGSDRAVTETLRRIGAAPRMTLYWNELQVMTVDALAVAEPAEGLDKRVMEATGVLAAEVIPPLLPIDTACRTAQLDLPGRRAACAAVMARMEQSDTVITQIGALEMQASWWSVGSLQRQALRAKRRQIDYLLAMSSAQWRRGRREATVRMDAARRSAREEDVELAVLKANGLPVVPPPDWPDPYIRG